MTKVADKEGENTNITRTKGGDIKFGGKCTIALTQNNQDGENTSKDTTEGIPCRSVWKFIKTSSLTSIRTTETNMNTSNTCPTDETSDSRKSLEPNKSLISTIKVFFSLLFFLFFFVEALITYKWKQTHKQNLQQKKIRQTNREHRAY